MKKTLITLSLPIAGAENTQAVKQFLQTIASVEPKTLVDAAKKVNKKPSLIKTALKFL